MKEKSFAQELAELINRHGIDAKMNTNDWILADVAVDALNAYGKANQLREKMAIAGLLKQINADASGKPQNDIPEEVKEVAGKLAKAFGARVEIHRIEIPEKKRKFRKKPRKEQGNETR